MENQPDLDKLLARLKATGAALNGIDLGLGNLAERFARIFEPVRRLNRAGEGLVIFNRRVSEIGRDFAAGLRRLIAEEFGEAAADVFSVRAMMREGSDTDHLDAHLSALAEGLAARWRPYGHAERVALRDRAQANERSIDEEKVDLARVGLLLAATDLDRPQTIRLGTRWVVDDEGRKVEIPPSELMFGHAIRWYASAAKAAMTAVLLDEGWPYGPSGNLETLEDAIFVADVTRSPLDDLIYQQETALLLDRLAGAGLTPAEKDLYDAYLVSGSWLEAYEACGIVPAAGRQRKRGLMQKMFPPDG
jgi:hypothetical protein